jgi:hypothetical protein
MRCAPRKVFLGSWSDVPLSVSDLSIAVLFPVPFLDAELRHRDDSQGKNLTQLTTKPGQRLIVVLGRIERNSFFLCLFCKSIGSYQRIVLMPTKWENSRNFVFPAESFTFNGKLNDRHASSIHARQDLLSNRTSSWMWCFFYFIKASCFGRVRHIQREFGEWRFFISFSLSPWRTLLHVACLLLLATCAKMTSDASE